MQYIRTPDNRFVDLPDYAFEPHYAEIDDADGGTLRVHYLDEGPADADPVLLLHGEPSWSYLYRHMIPVLVEAGHRVVVPDLVGFGRSDKPTEQADYTYARHVEWLAALVIGELDLRAMTLFCQDWGGLLGLRLVAAQPDRFARVVVGNTFLPTGHGSPSEAFLAWQEFSQATPEFKVGRIVSGGCVRDLEPGEVLVAPITDPAWTPLFLPSAAVVVNVGALMSHAVIVSRELGIPCVVSVEEATSRIPNGALVEVDGTAGTVTILEG